jgi:hypothetical protein
MKEGTMETICEEAVRLVAGARGSDYGHPLDNHSTTAELFNAYLHRKYGTFVYGLLDADDVCWFNILQKCSRDANAPKRDNLVDVAGYAENIQIVRDERERRAEQEQAEACE